MRVSGRTLMTVAAVAAVGAMVFTAWSWPFRAALFPLAVGIPVLLLTVIELICVITGRTETLAEESLGTDFRLSETADPRLAERRTVAIILWIIGFLLLILLTGFPLRSRFSLSCICDSERMRVGHDHYYGERRLGGFLCAVHLVAEYPTPRGMDSTVVGVMTRPPNFRNVPNVPAV